MEEWKGQAHLPHQGCRNCNLSGQERDGEEAGKAREKHGENTVRMCLGDEQEKRKRLPERVIQQARKTGGRRAGLMIGW